MSLVDTWNISSANSQSEISNAYSLDVRAVNTSQFSCEHELYKAMLANRCINHKAP